MLVTWLLPRSRNFDETKACGVISGVAWLQRDLEAAYIYHQESASERST